MSVPRVVLDTNCLVSALIFSRGRFTWLREAWQAKRFSALASHDTVSELLRVLAYPKFTLTRDEQETLLADFLPYVETVKIDQTPEGLPGIRDADDIIFLVLAAVAQADALVSGDGDIQAVRDQFHIPILTVAEFADWLDQDQ
jgi:putative toxin-antitoxin system toxin component, PIN family